MRDLNAPLYSVFGSGDGKTLWAVGAGGTILHSSDGQTWSPQKSGTTQVLLSVCGSGDGKSLWAVGVGGTILHSSDGQTWRPQKSGTTQVLLSVFGSGDGKSLWAVGSGGTILRSSDGQSWNWQNSWTTPALYSVFGSGDGKSLWAVGVGGRIVLGSTTSDRLPFLSGARVFGKSLSVRLTCPWGAPAQGSVDVSASSDVMLSSKSQPKPVGTLQISQACQISDLQFDPAALNLASGAKVHFFAAVHLSASTQNYTIDATYAPWLGYWMACAGVVVVASLVFFLFRYRRGWFRRSMQRTEITPPSLEKLRDDATKRLEQQQSEEEQLVKNLEDNFQLRSFDLKNVRFFEDCSYEFRPRVNVLLGRNGHGKTLLLRTLAATIQSDLENGGLLFPAPAKGSSPAAPGPKSPVVTLRVERNEKPEETVRDPVYFSKTTGRIPLLAIPDSRFVNRQVQELGPPKIRTEPLCRSGARHFITQEPYENKVLELLYNLCLDYSENRKSFQQPVFRLIQQVIRELTDDEKFAFHSIGRVAGTNAFKIFVAAAGNENEPLPIQYASQGTLSVLVIFGQIFYFLQTLRPKITGDAILQVPGIVIIDEIDAHLHPSWQQKVVGMLMRIPSDADHRSEAMAITIPN